MSRSNKSNRLQSNNKPRMQSCRTVAAQYPRIRQSHHRKPQSRPNHQLKATARILVQVHANLGNLAAQHKADLRMAKPHPNNPRTAAKLSREIQLVRQAAKQRRSRASWRPNPRAAHNRTLSTHKGKIRQHPDARPESSKVVPDRIHAAALSHRLTLV